MYYLDVAALCSPLTLPKFSYLLWALSCCLVSLFQLLLMLLLQRRLLHLQSKTLSKEKSSNGHGPSETHLSPGVFKRKDYKNYDSVDSYCSLSSC